MAIPYPYAKDNHQYYNAEFYENRDGSYYIDSSIEEAFEIINRIFPNNYELIEFLKITLEILLGKIFK